MKTKTLTNIRDVLKLLLSDATLINGNEDKHEPPSKKERVRCSLDLLEKIDVCGVGDIDYSHLAFCGFMLKFFSLACLMPYQ